MVLHLEKRESPYPRILCAKFGGNWLSGSGEDFLISSMYFHYFIIISPWKWAGPFIWTNLNPLYPRIIRAKLGWYWLSGSVEDDFLNFVNVFSLFYISPWKWAGPFICKLESPSPNDALCQVQSKLAQWFLRRRFLNWVNVFSLFRNYLPLTKVGDLHLNKIKSPLPKNSLCKSWY